MTRTADSVTIDASKAEHIIPMIMAKLDFSSGFVTLNNTGITKDYGGYTYLGAGYLVDASPVEEGIETKPYTINLSLSGIPSTYISIALGEHYQGRDAELYLALLDEDYDFIGTPVLMFAGRMDTMDIEVGETATITMTVQSRLADWDRPRVERFNHETQISKYPGDLGLEFISEVSEKTLLWGVPT